MFYILFVTLIGLLLIVVVTFILTTRIHVRYWYMFEEKVVAATHLEAARRQLEDTHSPLVRTNDPSLV